MRVCWCGGVHDLTFKGFECLPVAPLLGSFFWGRLRLGSRPVWQSRLVQSLLQRLFLRFLCFIGGRRRDSEQPGMGGRGDGEEFLSQLKAACPAAAPSPRGCAHTARLTAQAGGFSSIQWVWAARLIPLRGSKPRGAPLTRAVWPRWFRRMMNSREKLKQKR